MAGPDETPHATGEGSSTQSQDSRSPGSGNRADQSPDASSEQRRATGRELTAAARDALKKQLQQSRETRQREEKDPFFRERFSREPPWRLNAEEKAKAEARSRETQQGGKEGTRTASKETGRESTSQRLPFQKARPPETADGSRTLKRKDTKPQEARPTGKGEGGEPLEGLKSLLRKEPKPADPKEGLRTLLRKDVRATESGKVRTLQRKDTRPPEAREAGKTLLKKDTRPGEGRDTARHLQKDGKPHDPRQALKEALLKEARKLGQEGKELPQLKPLKLPDMKSELNVAEPTWFDTLPVIGRKVTEAELTVFTRQLATMLDSGLPVVQCLNIQARQAQNPLLKAQLAYVKRRVESGSTLADAMRRFPRTFDKLFVSLVQAGEAGGVLDTILGRLASYIEKNGKLKRQVRAAVVYPVAIAVVAVAIVALLVFKVVPVFERMFGSFGAELPQLTQIVIDVSRFIKGNFLAMGVALGVTSFLLSLAYRSRDGRHLLDAFLLRLPVFGDIVIKVSVARFARTLSTMLASAVPILQAMEICARTAGNRVIERSILDARVAIAAGKPVATPLLSSKVFPVMVCQMISVGEATGTLEEMLAKIADFYEYEVETAVGAMVSLIEPAMMAFLGVVIGGLVISMYLPIFVMSSAIGGGGG